MKKSNFSTRDIVYIALYGALFIAVEYFQNVFQLLKMPQGGSLGISSIVLLMASYKLGWKKGLIVSLISVPLQFITGIMYLEGGLIGFLLDYVVGFGIYGIACLLPNFGYFYSGVFVTNAIRFASSTVAGTLVWQTPIKASIVYNATYMIPTAIIGLVLVPLVSKRLKNQ